MRTNIFLSSLAVLAVSATPLVAQGFSAEVGISVDDVYEEIVDPGKHADVNGDGLLDVVCSQASTLLQGTAVLLGRADGTLSDPVESVLFDLSVPVRLGDFDGDGRTDLWTYSTIDDALKVRRGQLDGSFEATPTTLPIALEVSDFIVHDIDGDGDDDAIWSEEAGSRVHVVESIGGALVETSQFIVPSGPKDLAFGDVTANGFDDIVVSAANAIAVLEGTASGFAASQTLLNLGPTVNDMRLADFRGDATLDIILSEGNSVGPPSSAFLFIFEGGDDLFVTQPQELYSAVDDEIDQWLITDINGDSLNDIVRASSKLTVELQNVDGTFTTSSRQQRGTSFTVADITRDGNLDLVVLSVQQVSVREGHAEGIFEGSIGFSSLYNTLLAGDMNGDGLADIVSIMNQEIDVRLASPSGGFAVSSQMSSTINTNTAKLTDIDLDGDLDLLVALTGSILRFVNDGTGAVFLQPPQTIASSTHASIGDFTGDGIDDIAVVEAGGFGVILYEGTGTAIYTETPFGNLGFTPDFTTIADIDHDGVDDVIYINNARTTAVTLSGLLDLGNGGSNQLRAFAFADVEGDGELEMLLAKPFGATSALGFQVRRPNADGQFVSSFFVDTGLTSTGFEIVDLDQDGDDDIVLVDDALGGLLSRRLSAWIDDGAGQLTQVSELVDIAVSDLVIEDLNGDGLVDALIGVFSDARVLRNTQGPWTELGQSLAGSAGLSGLDGRGALTSNGEIELTITSATPNAASSLIVGFSELAAPFKGGVLVPSPDVILTGLVTDASGAATLPATMPAGVPAGVELFFQAWFVEGAGDFASTTGLRGVTY